MRLSTIAAALVFSAVPTLASAHAGNDSPNVVHACIGNVSKTVRIVGVSGSCVSAPAQLAETPAHWDIQGPPGTNGTNGTNGTSVTFVGYFGGDQHGCPNGGAIYATGSVNAYVCNGKSATHPDGPCFDNTNRYVNCGNGTVTDTVTGLVWLKNAACLGSADWAAANGAAAGLKDGDCGGTLTDKSSPGDWRLPTIDEWSATTARAVALGCILAGPGNPPSLTNDAGTGCFAVGTGSSFAGVASGNYWSCTSSEIFPNFAFAANLGLGLFSGGIKSFSVRVWPVRGAPR
jgi:hypothetical protein